MKVLVFWIFAIIGGGAQALPPPDQGFFLIVNTPERDKFESRDLYLYALNTDTVVNGSDVIEMSKEDLPYWDSGEISVEDTLFGCYLRVPQPLKMRGAIFGRYEATFMPGDGGDPIEREAFVKQESKILDTNGIYTETIYPAEAGSTALSDDSPRYIGFRAPRGNLRIKWFRVFDRYNRRRGIGPREELETTDDAGLYLARRRSRGNRGWAVYVRVIAADCPKDMYWNNGTCENRTVICQNGGVGKNSADECLCPPFFVGSECSAVVGLDPSDDGPFVLASSDSTHLQCKDLPGGHRECRGNLFCLGDLYGCKCSPGWTGNRCTRPCVHNWWGVECSQQCTDGCSPFFGPDARN